MASVFGCICRKLVYMVVSQDTTRMSMTVVVREALCVYAGDAWAL